MYSSGQPVSSRTTTRAPRDLTHCIEPFYRIKTHTQLKLFHNVQWGSRIRNWNPPELLKPIKEQRRLVPCTGYTVDLKPSFATDDPYAWLDSGALWMLTEGDRLRSFRVALSLVDLVSRVSMSINGFRRVRRAVIIKKAMLAPTLKYRSRKGNAAFRTPVPLQLIIKIQYHSYSARMIT